MKLYYELTTDGYHIYDEEDALFHIHQYDPYIPDKTKNYEENAKAQIAELTTSAEQSKEEILQEYRNQIASEVTTNA